MRLKLQVEVGFLTNTLRYQTKASKALISRGVETQEPQQRHPEQGDVAQKPMDLGFIALLFLISVSGLGLWLARSHASMPTWLAVHLGAVMALFATLPYNKFAHGIFRTASLLRHAVEKRQPNPIGLGSD